MHRPQSDACFQFETSKSCLPQKAANALTEAHVDSFLATALFCHICQ